MARKPRIHFEGGVYHVMLRGNGGQKIFFGEEDHARLYLLLQVGRDVAILNKGVQRIAEQAAVSEAESQRLWNRIAPTPIAK